MSKRKIPPHGTYGRYQRERKSGKTTSADCRKASAEYHANRRKSIKVREREKRQSLARDRAKSLLAERHPDEYKALYRDELTRLEDR